ncbi:hypothetical protein GEV33_010711 [Tenebrio molitor]|uniref:Uncharacterized protein n=1 Tax=Tenebrio molitor TaxID=7067 RepID=A0A8J6L5W1_TENMO|nr:hypothetical protein GEV33_010711 [Tenebrio molitor]
MDKEMKTTMIREMRDKIKTLRKELAAVREENGELRKELATVREEMRGREEKGQLEKADWMKRMEMIEEKMEQREKKERKNNVIITGIGAISGNVERGVEEWLEREIGVKVNVKEAFKINKDKMMLAKIENWEQKKNIMLNDDLTKEERETQKKLRELAREERDRGKRTGETEENLLEEDDSARKCTRRRGGDEERENRNGKEGEEREKVQEVTRGQFEDRTYAAKCEREREGNGEKYGAKTAGRWMKE